MTAKHTPGPWKYYKDARFGPSGNKHADLFFIHSDTRKHMAVLEVWSLNSDPKWRRAHKSEIKEHAETLREVGANARLIAAAPSLLEALRGLLSRYPERAGTYTPEGATARELLNRLDAPQ